MKHLSNKGDGDSAETHVYQDCQGIKQTVPIKMIRLELLVILI